MQYASAQDMRDRYPEQDLREITDPEAAAIDDAKLEKALLDASDEIDSYLAGRYVLPLAAPPAVFVLHACTIAMYRLQALRPLQDIEDARKRYEDTVRYLTRIAKGEIALELPAAAQPTQVLDVRSQAGARVFTRDSTRGF